MSELVWVDGEASQNGITYRLMMLGGKFAALRLSGDGFSFLDDSIGGVDGAKRLCQKHADILEKERAKTNLALEVALEALKTCDYYCANNSANDRYVFDPDLVKQAIKEIEES